NQGEQQQLLDLVTAIGATAAVPAVAERLRLEKNEQGRARRLEATEGCESPTPAEALLGLYPSFGPRLQTITPSMVSLQPNWAPVWALVVVRRMGEGGFNPGGVSASNLTAIQRYSDPEIRTLLARYQRGRADDPAERTALDLSEKGRNTYALNCGACHQPDGQG